MMPSYITIHISTITIWKVDIWIVYLHELKKKNCESTSRDTQIKESSNYLTSRSAIAYITTMNFLS